VAAVFTSRAVIVRPCYRSCSAPRSILVPDIQLVMPGQLKSLWQPAFTQGALPAAVLRRMDAKRIVAEFGHLNSGLILSQLKVSMLSVPGKVSRCHYHVIFPTIYAIISFMKKGDLSSCLSMSLTDLPFLRFSFFSVFPCIGG